LERVKIDQGKGEEVSGRRWGLGTISIIQLFREVYQKYWKRKETAKRRAFGEKEESYEEFPQPGDLIGVR